jgi:hypothetical protein
MKADRARNVVAIQIQLLTVSDPFSFARCCSHQKKLLGKGIFTVWSESMRRRIELPDRPPTRLILRDTLRRKVASWLRSAVLANSTRRPWLPISPWIAGDHRFGSSQTTEIAKRLVLTLFS